MYGSVTTLTAAIDETSLIQLSDDEQVGTMNEATVLECGATAFAKVNGYLRGLVELPLPSEFPDKDLLVSIERDLWVVELYARRPGASVPDGLLRKAEKAEATLKAIKRREIVLDLGTASGVTSSLGMVTDKTESDRAFSDEILRKW